MAAEPDTETPGAVGIETHGAVTASFEAVIASSETVSASSEAVIASSEDVIASSEADETDSLGAETYSADETETPDCRTFCSLDGRTNRFPCGDDGSCHRIYICGMMILE